MGKRTWYVDWQEDKGDSGIMSKQNILDRHKNVVWIIFVVGIGAVLFYIFGIAGGLISYVDGTRQNCINMQGEMTSRQAGLQARSHSLGGILDVNGDLHAAIAQYNIDVDNFHSQCGRFGLTLPVWN